MDHFNYEAELCAAQSSAGNLLRGAWQSRRYHMQLPSIGSFYSHHFKHVMAALLSVEKPYTLLESAWLQKMFHMCQRSGAKEGRGCPPQTRAHSMYIVWYVL